MQTFTWQVNVVMSDGIVDSHFVYAYTAQAALAIALDVASYYVRRQVVDVVLVVRVN